MTETVLHVSDTRLSTEQFSEGDTPLGGLSAVVQQAIQRDVDAVAHSGSLFRRPEPDPELVEALAERFTELESAGIPFLAVEGQRESHREVGGMDALAARGLLQRATSEPTQMGTPKSSDRL